MPGQWAWRCGSPRSPLCTKVVLDTAKQDKSARGILNSKKDLGYIAPYLVRKCPDQILFCGIMWFFLLKIRASHCSTCLMDKISKPRDIYELFYTKVNLWRLTPRFE